LNPGAELPGSRGHRRRLILIGSLLSFTTACFSGGEGTDASALLPLLAVAAGSATANCPSSTAIDGAALADVVTSAPGANAAELFKDPAKAVNGVCGSGTGAGSFDVYSIPATGANAVLTLEWSGRRVTNGTGADFVVFENPFYQNNDSSTRFMEPAVVEVQDQITGDWCGFAPDYAPTGAETVYSQNPTHWQNFAGVTPVLYNQVSNPLGAPQVFDSALAGGDGFDLSNLSAANQFGNGCSSTARGNILANGFVYLRIRPAAALTNPDSAAAFPQDTGAFGGGPDIDGVVARYVVVR
jgi:hypothetical protein